MNNVKILHIDTEMGWRGGQQQAVYLFENLFKKGYSTEFVCKPGSELSSYFKKNDLPSIEVKISNELDLISAYKIAQYSKKNNFTILHLHSAHAHSIGLLAKLFYRKLKLIGVRRVDFKIKNSFVSRLKYNSKLIDRIVCISEEIKKVLLSCGINKDKLIVIHSGVNTNKFDNVKAYPSLRKQYNIPESDLIIGTVAALVGHKDYPNLLKAAYIVLKNITNVTFLAVGDGKNEDDIKKLHHELGLKNKFIFAGYQKEVGKFLRSFDIFILASKMEGLGTSILDAQSIGLPVIATRAGGIPEMVTNGVNGILVDTQSPEQLATAITYLIDNEDKRQNIGSNGKVSVEQFSIDRTVEKNINLYEELLGSEK